jgi:hypothetical protein
MSVTVSNARQVLFSAIQEGRFESIPQWAADYKRDVQAYLLSAEDPKTLGSLHEWLKPLADAIQYLRVVRAQQSAQFQKLAVDSLYQSAGPVSKGGSLNLDA